MKALVVYDSLYGNTEKVASAIADAVGGEARQVDKVATVGLTGLGLLIVGSPTHGGRPSPRTLEFLEKVPAGALDGVRVAAFDTRFEKSSHGLGLRLLMRVIDFAAPRIAVTLEKRGGKLIARPEGFIVKAREGPLKEGEVDRAFSWAKEISQGPTA